MRTTAGRLALTALITVLSAPTAHAAPADAASTRGAEAPSAPIVMQPEDTRRTDGVLTRQSFDQGDHARRSVTHPDRVVRPSGDTRVPQVWPARWSSSVDQEHATKDATDPRGWHLTSREQWTAPSDDMRSRFGRTQGAFAVVDPSRSPAARQGGAVRAELTSAPVRVSGQDAVEISFDSHYRGAPGQVATATVTFDDSTQQELSRFDSATVADGYDGAQLNANVTRTVPVPEDARTARVTWTFDAPDAASARYWALDSFRVREALGTPAGDPTSAWVVSDIQGHPQDLSHGLRDLHDLRPDAAGLLMVGDLTANGLAEEWAEVDDAMDENRQLLPETVAAAIGNHESYGGEGWPTHRDRFLDFAQRDEVYGEYVLDGPGGQLPVLVLGQEADRTEDTEVIMSAEQLAWLDERLDHWTEQGRQVLVVSHFPLGDTHSASWIPWYHEHYQDNDLLTRMLADHPNAITLNGHTHYPAELGDWAVERRADGAHPDGFWAVNTLAMQVEWDARGEDTDQIDEVVTGDINRGLTVDSYGDRVVITAHDFGPVGEGADNDANREIRSVTIPNPLA